MYLITYLHKKNHKMSSVHQTRYSHFGKATGETYSTETQSQSAITLDTCWKWWSHV